MQQEPRKTSLSTENLMQAEIILFWIARLDVIKSADWVVDLGPEGGDRGGKIVAMGTPEEVSKVKSSFTGQFLKDSLSKSNS